MKKTILLLAVFALALTVFAACGVSEPSDSTPETGYKAPPVASSTRVATGVQPWEVCHRTVNINGKLYYSKYTNEDVGSIRKESAKIENDSGLSLIGKTVRVDNDVYPSEHLTQTNFYQDIEVYQYNNGESYYYFDITLTSYVPLIPAPEDWIPGEAPQNQQ